MFPSNSRECRPAVFPRNSPVFRPPKGRKTGIFLFAAKKLPAKMQGAKRPWLIKRKKSAALYFI
ncbi:MAG: hypothetical protein BHW37_01460 [Firmicutes bacterium CAG:272_52_7]|nr:MAG: hypothetical protein BHW37_01460 [Firmicutes bacterium CAG:272_52_7]